MNILYPQKMKDAFPSEEDCPGFKDACVQFMTKANTVSLTVLRCLALGLGYDEEFFTPVGNTVLLFVLDLSAITRNMYTHSNQNKCLKLLAGEHFLLLRCSLKMGEQ